MSFEEKCLILRMDNYKVWIDEDVTKETIFMEDRY
jgi:hypothetical protein